MKSLCNAQGIPINAEDGVILNRNVSKDPAGLAMASDLNAMYGGIRFMQSGGPVNSLNQSVSSSSTGTDFGSTGTAFRELIETLNNNFAKLANEISDWQRNLKINNNVRETREGINMINKPEADAGF